MDQRWGRQGVDRKRRRGPSHPLLEFRLLLQGHGVSLSNDRDDVHNFAEVFHELQIKRSQAGAQRRQGVRASLPYPTQPLPPFQVGFLSSGCGCGLSSPPTQPCVVVTRVYLILPMAQRS